MRGVRVEVLARNQRGRDISDIEELLGIILDDFEMMWLRGDGRLTVPFHGSHIWSYWGLNYCLNRKRVTL